MREIDNMFTPEECRYLIDKSEHKGYTSTQQNKFGNAIDNPVIRTDCFISWSDSAIVKRLQERVASILPAEFNGMAFAGIDHKLKFNRYDVGQDFKPHNDAALVKNRRSSLLTLMMKKNASIFPPHGVEPLRARASPIEADCCSPPWAEP